MTRRTLGATMVVAWVGVVMAQRPAFRGGTTIVPLTVSVFDKKGEPVTDLAATDFTITENDVRQDLRAFFPQPLVPRASPAEATTPALAGAPGGGALGPETRRSVLLVLGRGRIQVPGKGVDAAITFVRERLLPQDMIAVIAFNRASEFTNDHEQVARLLERYRREHERIFSEITEFQIRHPLTDLPESLQQEMDNVFAPDPRRSAVDLLLGMDGVRARVDQAWNRQTSLTDVKQQAARDHKSLTDLLIDDPSLKLFAGIEYLRQVEGQRRLVWLGAGLHIASVDDDKRMAARANDARVVMDIVHTVGIASSANGWDISSGENIAEFTGGSFTGVESADKALARVDARSRFSYLLGYAPTNPTLDGKYRQVKVTVNRPGLTVVFQHGYYAVADLPPLEHREALTAARLQTAANSDEPVRDIGLEATAAALPVFGGRREVRVDVRVDISRLALTSGPAGRSGVIDLQVSCGDAKKRLVGDLTQRFELTFDEDTYQRAMADRLPISVRVPVTDIVKFYKIVAYDYGSDRVGSFFLTIK